MMPKDAIAALAILCIVLLAWAIIATVGWRSTSYMVTYLQKHNIHLRHSNPYARLLGRVVEAKVYEGSKWEKVLVVAVSWRGSVCVRPVRDLSSKGRWIHKTVAPERVRELEGEQ